MWHEITIQAFWFSIFSVYLKHRSPLVRITINFFETPKQQQQHKAWQWKKINPYAHYLLCLLHILFNMWTTLTIISWHFTAIKVYTVTSKGRYFAVIKVCWQFNVWTKYANQNWYTNIYPTRSVVCKLHCVTHINAFIDLHMPLSIFLFPCH